MENEEGHVVVEEWTVRETRRSWTRESDDDTRDHAFLSVGSGTVSIRLHPQDPFLLTIVYPNPRGAAGPADSMELTVRMTVYAGGEVISPATGRIENCVRDLNLETGALGVKLQWISRTSSCRVALKATTVPLWCHPGVVYHALSVSADDFIGAELRLIYSITGNISFESTGTPSQRWLHAMSENCVAMEHCTGRLSFSAPTDLDTGVCVPRLKSIPSGVESVVSAIIENGGGLRFRRASALVRPNESRSSELASIADKTLKDILAEQRKGLREDFWAACDVKLSLGAECYQGLLRMNQLRMLQPADKEPIDSSGAWRGLSLLAASVNPRIRSLAAREELRRIVESLPSALDRAQQLGLDRGAVFDEEPHASLLGGNPSGHSHTLRLYRNTTAAWAALFLYRATGDNDVMRDGGLHVVLASALGYLEWGSWFNGQFHLRRVTGLGDDAILLDDHILTNVLARCHFGEVMALREVLKQRGMSTLWDDATSSLGIDEDTLQKMQRASETTALVTDPVDGVLAAADDCGPPSVFGAVDVVCALALHGTVYFGLVERKAAFRALQAVVDSVPLARPLLVIIAGASGASDMACDMLRASLKQELRVTERCVPGSLWAAIAYGLGRLESEGGGDLRFSPWLPEGSQNYAFAVNTEGSLMQIDVCKRSVTYVILSGRPVQSVIHRDEHRLRISVHRPQTIRHQQDRASAEYDAVIFDLGAIVQLVENDHYRAWRVVLGEYSKQCGSEHELSQEHYLAYVRHHPSLAGQRFSGLQKLIGMLGGPPLPLGSATDPPGLTSVYAVVNRKLEVFRRIVTERGIALTQGADKLIGDLWRFDIAVGCVSSSMNGRWMLSQTALSSRMEAFIDGVEGDKRHLEWRPGTQYFDECAKALETTPSRCILVMDDIRGFSKTSLRQYAMVLCTNSEGNDESALRAAGATDVIRGLSDVSLEWLDNRVGLGRSGSFGMSLVT